MTQIPDDLYIPEALYDRADGMRRIREIAQASNIHPDGVYGTVVTRLMTTLHPSVTARVTGRTTPLSVTVGIVSPPGGGKSTCVGIGCKVVPFPKECGEIDLPDAEPWWMIDPGLDWRTEDSISDRGLGTSEGLTSVLVRKAPGELTGSTHSNEPIFGPPPVPTLPRRTRSFISATEASQLMKLKGRTGTDYLTALLGGFSSDKLDNNNADEDRSRTVGAGTYRQCVLLAMQYEVMGELLTDAGLGLPQRFRFVMASEIREVSDSERKRLLESARSLSEEDAREQMEALGINEVGLKDDDPAVLWLKNVTSMLALLRNVTFTFPANAVHYMHILNQTNAAPGARLDSHEAAQLIRIAVEQQILDTPDVLENGLELEISQEAWEAALELMAVSQRVREYVITQALHHQRAVENERIQKSLRGSMSQARAMAAQREMDDVTSRAVSQVLMVLKKSGPIGRAELRRGLKSDVRQRFDSVMEYLEETGEVVRTRGPRGGDIFSA